MILFVFVFAVLSCGLVTGCGHTLSGKYSNADYPNSYISFYSDGKIDGVDENVPMKGDYHWNDKEKCYYLECYFYESDNINEITDHVALTATPEGKNGLRVRLLDDNKNGSDGLLDTDSVLLTK